LIPIYAGVGNAYFRPTTVIPGFQMYFRFAA